MKFKLSPGESRVCHIGMTAEFYSTLAHSVAVSRAPGPVRFAGGDDDDLFSLHDDDGAIPDPSAMAPPWVVLIVDDDADVHQSTLLALRGERILGRPLTFRHAYNGPDALRILKAEANVDIVLLDVVMESQDAGLRLVAAARNDLKLVNMKIILRTGQPGYAPEAVVTRDYSIDGYLTKENLTRTLLLQAISGSLADGTDHNNGELPH